MAEAKPGVLIAGHGDQVAPEIPLRSLIVAELLKRLASAKVDYAQGPAVAPAALLEESRLRA